VDSCNIFGNFLYDTFLASCYFVSGAVGEWKKHLTVAQSEYVDEKVKKILGDTGIEFIYELND